MTPTGGSTTTTTTNITNNSTITTTTINYTTGNGSNAGEEGEDDDEPDDGTGSPDGGEDGEDSATDSGNCSVPPVCVGDTLKCLMLRYSWRTTCASEGHGVEGGSTCAEQDVPICAGSKCRADQYAQVLQQWRARCDAESVQGKLAADAATGSADAAGDDEAGTIASLWGNGEGTEPSFNTGLISIGGGDVLPNVEIHGVTFSQPAEFTNALAIIRQLVIVAAMAAAFWILMRK